MTKLTGLIFPRQYHLLEELETQGGSFCGNLPGFLLNECWGNLSLFSPKKSPDDPNAARISPNTYACVHVHTHTCMHANCEWQGPTAFFPHLLVHKRHLEVLTQ